MCALISRLASTGRAVLASFTVIAGVGAGIANSAPAPAGETIANQASATYFNMRLGTVETITSNTVKLQVLPVAGFEVTGEQQLQLFRGSRGQYNFHASNTGNVPLDASFTMDELAGDDFDVSGDLILDLNGNGIADGDEPVLSPGEEYPLAVGETISLIYAFRTPTAVENGDFARSTLQGSAVPKQGPAGELTDSKTSTAVIAEGALSITKSGATRGEDGIIDYTLRVRNNADIALQPYAEIGQDTIEVDGTPRTALLVRDFIPLNTALIAAESSGGFTAVYHRRGDAKHSYVSQPASSAEEMDAVAFLLEGPYEVGRSSDLKFSVKVLDNVGTTEIVNIAETYVPTGTGVRTQTSNEVITPVEGPGQTIEFKTPDASTPLTSVPFETDVIVEIGAASCNKTREIDTISVRITTEFSGDEETLTAVETGANTGIFRTEPIAVVRDDNAVHQSGVIEGSPGDAAGAKATAVCLGETLETTLDVQPGSFVFDSVTNEPIEGARVIAYISESSVGALQLEGPLGGIEGALAIAGMVPISGSMTDAFGYFDLGAIPRGRYLLQVFPPDTYVYPSVRTSFEGFQRDVEPRLSYGVEFNFDGGPISGIDIPVDPTSPIPLTLDKQADRRSVRRGGYVVYTLDARNTLAQALVKSRIEDILPPGFLYVDGSARLDEAPLAKEPEFGPGSRLTFSLGEIAPKSNVQLTYVARVGATAGRGDQTNVATLHGVQAGTGSDYVSSQARSTVSVDDRGGVFADEAVVIGRVFLDRDGDGLQDDDTEPGVPGVKIVTSNGLAVVTDSEGRYSLFGLRPVTHTFALQKETLPAGAVPQLHDVDDAFAPGSRLIDLKRGELRSEDFPLTWTRSAAHEVGARVESARERESDPSRIRDDLPLTFSTTERLSSRRETAVDTESEILSGRVGGKERELPASDSKQAETLDIETHVKSLDPALAFVDIADGDEIGRTSISLRIKSPAEAEIRLFVNGEEIPESQIGAKAIHRAGGVQLYEFVAVRLSPGANKLKATVVDPFGNERGGPEITVFAPGEPAGLQIVAPKEASANARARIPVAVRVVDADGRRVRVPTEVTLTAENGHWDVRDIRDTVPGLQTFLDNGEGTLDFIPPDLVGGEKIGVVADFGSAEAEIAFTPDLTERTFVGVIEGAVKFGEKGSRLEGLMRKDDLNGFEETTEGVRGQLYLKGKILGDALLTLRYDSDQDTEERLFRDIRRDEFYPVYGDRSERGFDAQSSGPLYIKVEREQSYLLYGDIAIEPQTDVIRLGAYRRSLTGGRAHYENGRVTVDLFVAQTDQSQQVVEIRGRGVSGPYDVDLSGIVEGSEIVELITRDRDQPNVILSKQNQLRLTDYTVDFFRGTLIFNRPVPQLDDDLNPVSIRVTYETNDGRGDDYFVYGGEARVEITENIAIGYREVRSNADRSVDERRTVRAGYVEANFDKYGRVVVEAAQTENNLGEDGTGLRGSYEYSDGTTSLRAEAARTEDSFDAPNSYVSPGREEARVTAEHAVNDRLRVAGEALYTRGTETGEKRYGAEIRGQYAVSESLDVIGGLRGVTTDRSDEKTDVLSAIAGVGWRPSMLPGATLRVEFEQDLLEAEHWRVLLGGDYQWNPSVRFYALNEISTTESGFFGLGDGASTQFTTKVGAEYRLTETIDGFSEYRDGGSSDGGVANGMRATWKLNEYIDMRASVEHVEPVANDHVRSTSVTGGIVYDNPDQGLLLRTDAEWDADERGQGYYSNVAVSYELNRDFTLLARNRFAIDKRGDDRVRDRLRFGLAWRPEHDNRFKALALYEFEYDDNQSMTELAHRWSVGGTFDATDDLRGNLKYAGEYFEFNGDGFEDSSTLHLVRAGGEFDFAKDRFSLGGHVALFTDDSGESVTAGAGVEVKANLAKNIQVGLGYSHMDIEEHRVRDLYNSGFYVRLRLKLDGSAWEVFDRAGITGVEAPE